MTAIKLLPLPHFVGLPLPAYQSAQAAGLDIAAAVTDDVIIMPGTWASIPSGLCLELPSGYEAQVRPRSGLAARCGVTVLNSPGTIDADYRGELLVLLINHGREPFTVCRGMRIAQLVVAPVAQVTVELTETLTDSERGAGGFGSSGIK